MKRGFAALTHPTNEGMKYGERRPACEAIEIKLLRHFIKRGFAAPIQQTRE